MNFLKKGIPKFLWLLKPFLLWIDRNLTIKVAIKKVTGRDYYQHRDKIIKGTVFITDSFGHGSNLVNPSKGKHGAIYFGFKIKSALENVLRELTFSIENDTDTILKGENLKKFKRIKDALLKYEPNDDVCYVIEAQAEGVMLTDLITFMTTKDRFKAFTPNVNEDIKSDIMAIAANYALIDLGLGYDYGFEQSDDTKYCFEVVVDAYKSANPKLNFKPECVLGYQFYLASAFTTDPANWILLFSLGED